MSVWVSVKHCWTNCWSALEKTPTRAVVAVISLPNPASVALHEKCGFVASGVLHGVGWKFGTACDVGFWLAHLK